MSKLLRDRGRRERSAAGIAERALREAVELVGISSPSGDRPAAGRAVAAAISMLPAAARVERPPCSSADHEPDLLATLSGSGRGRLLLLGHLDTVFSHSRHRPAVRDGDRLVGSGTLDMKGGDALALGVLRCLADLPEAFERIALLLVNDEEFRTAPFAHAARFAGFDACLCFEGGERTAEGIEAVVVRRKAAAAIRVEASGVSAHSGANPDAGRSALLALGRVAAELAALHDPGGPEALSVVPTTVRAGEAINVVPGSGELCIDMRADREASFARVIESVPESLDGVGLRTERLRLWPGMSMAGPATAPLERAADLLGRPLLGLARGGASDASHLAAHVPVAIDGLGPIGGGAHSPDEHLRIESLQARAEVALALVAALLD